MAAVHPIRVALLFLLLAVTSACGDSTKAAGMAAKSDEGADEAVASETGQPIVPPFSVSGELEGLLLVWFDAEGPHTASLRSEVPETSRETVRVDSLSVAPDKRLDPDHVYVADLRAPLPDGQYAVHKHSRAWFEAQVAAARPAVAAAGGEGGVTLYKAAWCGACKAAASYFRSRNVTFEEKDIEKDPQANSEMLAKARAAGKSPTGVPVIDFRGDIGLGFNQGVLDQLIQRQQ
jgi:glutaredoxin